MVHTCGMATLLLFPFLPSEYPDGIFSSSTDERSSPGALLTYSYYFANPISKFVCMTCGCSYFLDWTHVKIVFFTLRIPFGRGQYIQPVTSWQGDRNSRLVGVCLHTYNGEFFFCSFFLLFWFLFFDVVFKTDGSHPEVGGKRLFQKNTNYANFLFYK